MSSLTPINPSRKGESPADQLRAAERKSDAHFCSLKERHCNDVIELTAWLEESRAWLRERIAAGLNRWASTDGLSHQLARRASELACEVDLPHAVRERVTIPPSPILTLTPLEVLNRLDALLESCHAQMQKANATFYSIGLLIANLESLPAIEEEHRRQADRIAAQQGGVAGNAFAIHAAALRFHPNPTTIPGIDRIQLLCYELPNGTGLTAANVRQLLARYCRLNKCSLAEAEGRSLVEVADTLEALHAGGAGTVFADDCTAARVHVETPAGKPPNQDDSHESARDLWERDPVEAFEHLRDCVVDAVNRVCEVHRLAVCAPEGAKLSDVASEHFDRLRRTVCDAQALWFDTPLSRYLDRSEDPVYLDTIDGRTIGRVSGSCYHDLALGVTVGSLKWIEASLPASDYAGSMRFSAAVGDYVPERLTFLASSVRCECQAGIARWRADEKATASQEKVAAPMSSGRDAKTKEAENGNERCGSEGSRRRRQTGGRKRLETSNPRLFQVYDRIRKEHVPGAQYADTLVRLKSDKNFREQVADVQRKLDSTLIKTALAFFDARKKDKRSEKNQETEIG
jgi:hypothetical protein